MEDSPFLNRMGQEQQKQQEQQQQQVERFHLELAQEFIKQSNFKEAIDQLTRIIQFHQQKQQQQQYQNKDEDDNNNNNIAMNNTESEFLAYLWRGFCYERLSQHNEAIEDLSWVLQVIARGCIDYSIVSTIISRIGHNNYEKRLRFSELIALNIIIVENRSVGRLLVEGIFLRASRTI